MKVQSAPPLHLTYGLNIHPGESWPDVRAAVFEKAAAIKARVAPDRPFGLGLRVSRAAASALLDPSLRRAFKAQLADAGFYVFTINGFPYGRFHGPQIKEQVYAPDWRTVERLTYTRDLADVLADLLPDGVSGSISTAPVSFRNWIRHDADVEAAAVNLARLAEHLDRLHAQTGRDLHVGLEPEPGCFLESTEEFLAFLKDKVWTRISESLHARVGLCLDACHAAVAFEDPSEVLCRCRAEGVRISKIQLSAALEAAPAARSTLAAFCEPAYLHQTTARLQDGRRRSWLDLPEALQALHGRTDIESVRVHFHVPLHFDGAAGLRSTAFTLNAGFFKLLREGLTEHLEIETYSLPVMPDAGRREVTESVAEEYRWVMERLS